MYTHTYRSQVGGDSDQSLAAVAVPAITCSHSLSTAGRTAGAKDLVSIARRQMRFHYKLRNSQIREHPECMMTSCAIFVVVVGSSFALGDVAPILDLVSIV